ncbi:hypothetical protein AOLI_G00054110 [Acnodon oligacanthus]
MSTSCRGAAWQSEKPCLAQASDSGQWKGRSSQTKPHFCSIPASTIREAGSSCRSACGRGAWTERSSYSRFSRDTSCSSPRA